MAEQIIMPKADWVAGLNKIRERGGAAGPIKSGEFETAVANIPQGGATLEKRDLTGFPYTSNGIKTIKPSPGYDGMSEVKVSLQVASEAKLQEKDLGVISTNGLRTIAPDTGYDGISNLKFDVEVPQGGGGGNMTIGRITLPEDRAVTVDSPLIITHSLGKIPTYFSLVISNNILTTGNMNYLFSITANNLSSGCSIKASYYRSNYPELYLFYGQGKISDGRHSSTKSFLDVWDANTSTVKLGAYRDVAATIRGNTEYTWVAISE